MWTLLIEVEKIVNERPITFMSESEVIKPLRPIDLAFPMLKGNEVDIADTNNDQNDPKQKMDDLVEIDVAEITTENLEKEEKLMEQTEEEETLSIEDGIIIEKLPDKPLMPKPKQGSSEVQEGLFTVNSPIWLVGDAHIEILAEVIREKDYRAMITNHPAEENFWTTLPARARLRDSLVIVILWFTTLIPNIFGILDWLTRIQNIRVIWIGAENPPYYPITTIKPTESLRELLNKLEEMGVKFEFRKVSKRKAKSTTEKSQCSGSTVVEPPNNKTFLRSVVIHSQKEQQQKPTTSQINNVIQPPAVEPRIVKTLHSINKNGIYEAFADHKIVKNYPNVPVFDYLAGEHVYIEGKGEAIAFFTKRYILSNFWPTTFWIRNNQYFSVEQFYCHQKCLILGKNQEAKEVMSTLSPGVAKRIATLTTKEESFIWANYKYNIMYEALQVKFSLPRERAALVSTHPAMILESSSDLDWGTGLRLEPRMKIGYGNNNLGMLLMIVRDQIIAGTEISLSVYEDSDKDFRSCASSPIPSINTQKTSPWGSTVELPKKQPTVELVEGKGIDKLKNSEEKREEKILEKFYETMENNYEERFEFITNLDSVLEKEIGECRAIPFGSTLSRLAKKKADIDVFVFMAEDGKPKEEKLKNIRNALRKHYQFDSLTVIARAKVPIIVAKFKNGFSIDLTVGGPSEMKGIYNSLALNVLGRLDEKFRVMFCAVKTWARNINDAKKGTLNSYSIVLLIQSFLFAKKWLPNIFELKPEIYQEEKIKGFVSSKLHCEIAKELKDEKLTKNIKVITMLEGFFKWFLDLDFTRFMVDSRTGNLIERNKSKLFKNDQVVILEPFTKEANSARAVNMKGWKEIHQLLIMTVESANNNNWNKWLELLGIEKPSWPCHGPPRVKTVSDSDSEPEETIENTLRKPSIIENMKNFALTNNHNQNEEYDPARNWKLSKFGKKNHKNQRVFLNSNIVSTMLIFLLVQIGCASFLNPMICHNEGNSKFVKISREKSACLNIDKIFDEKPVTVKLNLYRPDIKDYEFKAKLCTIVAHTVTYWTNIINDRFTDTKQTHIRMSKEECEEMIRTRTCKYGNLFGDFSTLIATTNKLEFAHTYWSIGKTKKSVTNCIIKTITLISRPGLDTLSAPLINVEHCRYSEGYCHIAEESIVVWNIEPKEGINAFWYNDKRRCVFKKFATRNGTLYRNGWLSNPNDLALTFADDPRTIMSCEEWLVISEQGIAVEQRQYDLMHGLIRNRKRREKELGILEGSVEVSQLDSQMQARSLFADRELRRAFATYSKMLCDYITDSALSGEDFSHLNPTLTIRKLANTNDIEARWIDKNILEFWPCTIIHKYHFAPTDGTCYKKLTVNVSISDSESYIKAFLDPLTFILSRQADKSQCEQNRIIAVVLNGIVSQVDQLTGKISQKTNNNKLVPPATRNAAIDKKFPNE
uniref:RNA uridylyltransferase n=1 Tax=Meloidogyne javanica TaxID=6303 RepID=A0A915N050_MELJA